MTITATAPTISSDPHAHGLVEDVFGLLSGTFVASLGIHLLHAAHVVTGGTAGLSLLVGYVSGWSFPLVYAIANLPFLLLAQRRKGWWFAARTLLSIGLVSAFSVIHPLALPHLAISTPYAAVVGNLLAGVGMLILFRHNASLGGFNTLALLVQERYGWRAGQVQLCCDAVVVGCSILVATPAMVALSALGAVVVNLVLAFNHRPGRYLGH